MSTPMKRRVQENEENFNAKNKKKFIYVFIKFSVAKLFPKNFARMLKPSILSKVAQNGRPERRMFKWGGVEGVT